LIQISKSALVPYAVDRAFGVVNDVAQYPKFLPGCVGSSVIEHSESQMKAQLEVAKAGIKYAFTTSNELLEPQSIILNLVDGPFKHFEGSWKFSALAESVTKIEFDLNFSMKSGLLARAIEGVVADISGQMVDAMCKRLDVLYGNSHK